jgi:hypothetical protein
LKADDLDQICGNIAQPMESDGEPISPTPDAIGCEIGIPGIDWQLAQPFTRAANQGLRLRLSPAQNLVPILA